jgi:hypothetical protein
MSKDIDYARIAGVPYLYQIYNSSPLSASLLSVGVYSKDFRFVQSLGTFIFFFFSFLSLGILKRKINADPVITFFVSALFLLVIDYTQIATNVRFWAAAGLIVFGTTLLCITGDNRLIFSTVGYVFCILAVLMHSGMTPLLIIIVIMKYSSWSVCKIVSFIMLFYTQTIKLFVPILSNSSVHFIATLGYKADNYLGISGDYSSSYDATRPLSWWILIYLTIGIVLGTIYVYYSNGRHWSLIKSPLSKIVICEIAFTIGSLTSWTISGRYAILGVMFSSPLLIRIFNGYLTTRTTSTGLHTTQGKSLLSKQILFIYLCLTILFMLYMRYKTTYPEYTWIL